MARPTLKVLDPLVAHQFLKPKKRIEDGDNVTFWLQSKAYSDVMMFLLQLNVAMFPQKSAQTSTSNNQESPTISRLQQLISKLKTLISEVPPDPGPRRFGNISFRRWYGKVEEQTPELLQEALPSGVLEFKCDSDSDTSPKEELASYLLGSFGSAQRLDFGTGHELSFLAFIAAIWKLGGFTASSYGTEERNIVHGVIDPYIDLIRELIKTYNLEPAGSHGVWGLDDHFFLPYIFGSAQLASAIGPSDPIPQEGSNRGAPKPGDVTNRTVVDDWRSMNMYFGAIGFIYDVKRGPFWEHSPMLYDISGVQKGWAKINAGMLKMYHAEVLSKFPVVQHFPFGGLFKWEADPEAANPARGATVHTSSQPRATTPTNTPPGTTATRLPPPTGAPWARPQPSGPVGQLGNRVSGRLPPPTWAVAPSNITGSSTSTVREQAGGAETPTPPS